MKRLITICVVMTMILAVSGTAQADLNWQTTPILGFGSEYIGDVVVFTGPQPLDGGGNPYHAWPDGPEVLGPVIPHYSIDAPAHDGDNLYQVGDPSMTVFTVGQSVHTGSGINVDPLTQYTWTSVFTGPSRTESYTGTFTTGAYNFFMLWNTPDGGGDGFGVANLTAADIGNWTYTETWTGSGITHTTDFTVVPVPGAVLLGILGLSVVGIKLRKHA